MYEFMCVVWQLVGSVLGLLLLGSLIFSVVDAFRNKEEAEDDD